MPGYEHPWELTLRQLITRLREYGFTFHAEDLIDPEGSVLTAWYLRSADSPPQIIPLPAVDLDMPLAPSVLKSVLRRLRLPPVDFGFDPDELDG